MDGPLTEDEIAALLAGVDEKTFMAKDDYLTEMHCSVKLEILLNMDDKDVQKIIYSFDKWELAKAMISIDSKISDKIFKNMTKRAAAILREEIEYIGPVRHNSIQYSQYMLEKHIEHMINTGEITV